MDGFVPERWTASDRNAWTASDRNRWTASSESAHQDLCAAIRTGKTCGTTERTWPWTDATLPRTRLADRQLRHEARLLLLPRRCPRSTLTSSLVRTSPRDPRTCRRLQFRLCWQLLLSRPMEGAVWRLLKPANPYEFGSSHVAAVLATDPSGIGALLPFLKPSEYITSPTSAPAVIVPWLCCP